MHGLLRFAAGFVVTGLICAAMYLFLKDIAKNPALDQENPAAGASAGKGSTGVKVGQLAPEIAGLDLTGQMLRLSSFRGKVVVLDFWGNW